MRLDREHHILIVGLRRSGTTILLETLRQNTTTRCYDEPFHPRLTDGARSNAKGTWTELAQSLVPSGTIAPHSLQPADELADDITVDHKLYLDSLFDSAPRVAIDLVRCWNHAPHLAAIESQPLVVTLVRDVQSWVQAQLLPSGRGTWRKSLVDPYRRASFFTRRGFYNNYHYQDIIDTALAQDHPMWRFSKLGSADMKHQPAFIKLMAFWWCANLTTLSALKQADQIPFIMTMHGFRADPNAELARLHQAAAWDPFDYDLNAIRRPQGAFKAAHPSWRTAADMIGLPVELLSTDADIATALKAHMPKGPQ